MPDANKLAKWGEIGYVIRRTCRGCHYARMSPQSSWGKCLIHVYEHEKHGGEPRQLTVHAAGTCSQFEWNAKKKVDVERSGALPCVESEDLMDLDSVLRFLSERLGREIQVHNLEYALRRCRDIRPEVVAGRRRWNMRQALQAAKVLKEVGADRRSGPKKKPGNVWAAEVLDEITEEDE